MVNGQTRVVGVMGAGAGSGAVRRTTSSDGGYWLVGPSSLLSQLSRKVSWATASAKARGVPGSKVQMAKAQLSELGYPLVS